MQKEQRRALVTRIHLFTSIIAMLTVLAFWVSTAAVELFCSRESVIAVKRLIPWGLFLLLPAVAGAGISGSKLAGRRTAGLFGVKLRRMKIIAANGVLVLVPSAIFLAQKGAAEDLDAMFYAVQAVELAAGAANLFLMGRNAYDGFRLGNRKHVGRVGYRARVVGEKA